VLPDGFEYSFSLRRGVWTLVRPRLFRSDVVWDQPRTGVNVGVTVSGGTVSVNLPDGRRYVFNDKGQLTQITFADGYTQTLTYTGDLNTRVNDSLGRWMEFTYGGADAPPGQPASLLTRARTDDGKEFLFTYEDRIGAGSAEYGPNTSSTDRWVLKSVTYPDGTPAVANDNPMAIYEYHPSSVRPFLLTDVMDREGVKSSTWTYDSKGRATSSAGSGGLDRWQYLYDDQKDIVTVGDPLGPMVTYGFSRGLTGNRELSTIDGNATKRSERESRVCLEDCAAEIRACHRLCRHAQYDPDMPNIWAGAYGRCMRGCVSERCGGNPV
jgi:hypothetical protein